jgi:four helix bundle suffix protein
LELLPPHGGYRRLKSFQIARLVHDVTVRICNRYISRRSRTHDQMVQAARSGVQNIAEGSQVSATSKKMEIKLTQVARASLEELRLDYEDFLRQRGLWQWPLDHPLRRSLINRRCQSADAVAAWVKEVAVSYDCVRPGRLNHPDDLYPEISANAALTLLAVACSLLDRQVQRLARDFESCGGFTERLYWTRRAARKKRRP